MRCCVVCTAPAQFEWNTPAPGVNNFPYDRIWSSSQRRESCAASDPQLHAGPGRSASGDTIPPFREDLTLEPDAIV